MNSIWREKYSIFTWFYLFCFLLFLGGTVSAQEILWQERGIGRFPMLRVAGKEGNADRVLIYSPFANQVESLEFRSGTRLWKRTFPERVPYAPLPLTDSVVVQGDQGTIWALEPNSGDIQWETKAYEPLDFPISPLRFRDGNIFTLSRNGWLRKIDSKGQTVKTARQPMSWGLRKAQTVPLRSFHAMLTYLDQSGRLTSYDPDTLAQTEQSVFAQDGQVSRAYGQSREALAGAVSPDRSVVFICQLPGLLQAYALESGKLLWSKRTVKPPALYSEQGELLALPTILKTDTLSAVITMSRNKLTVWNSADGRVLKTLKLPSPGVLAPVYDATSKTWWLLCQQHLVHLEGDLRTQVVSLPFADSPFSLSVRSNMAIIGMPNGRIFGMSLSTQKEVK